MESVTEFLRTLASKGIKLSVEAGRVNCYAQKGVLTTDIRAGIVSHKAEIIALLEGWQTRQQPQSGKSPSRQSREFPLSAGQKGLYILHKLHPGMSGYNVPLCFRINVEVDTELMAEAWRLVLEQFPILT